MYTYIHIHTYKRTCAHKPMHICMESACKDPGAKQGHAHESVQNDTTICMLIHLHINSHIHSSMELASKEPDSEQGDAAEDIQNDQIALGQKSDRVESKESGQKEAVGRRSQEV